MYQGTIQAVSSKLYRKNNNATDRVCFCVRILFYCADDCNDSPSTFTETEMSSLVDYFKSLFLKCGVIVIKIIEEWIQYFKKIQFIFKTRSCGLGCSDFTMRSSLTWK